MTRTRYGMIAGIAGAAFAGWWWRKRQGRQMTFGSDRGELVFSNAPVASETD